MGVPRPSVRSARSLHRLAFFTIARGRDVAVASADIVGQALDLQLLDELAVSLVPMLLSSGKAYFGTLKRGPIVLEDPTVISGARATHLRYRVHR